jgi:hypothetical protein
VAVKRVVDTDFWNDSKVSDLFSAEDKYFMLYLLTNPHTTQLGIYELSVTKTANELGYSKDVVKVLLERFQNKYELIRYNEITNEIAIKNFLRHSIVKGGKPVMDCLLKEEKKIKDKELLAYIFNNLNNYNDTLNTTVKEFISYITNIYNFNIYNNIYNDNDNERIVHESSTNRQNSKYDTVVDAWNTLVKVGINPVRSINTGSKRADCLRARVREYGEDAVLEAIENVKTSDFLQGKNSKGWRITFDWFVLPTNFPKVLEGNYNRRKPMSTPTAEMPTGLEKPKGDWQ